MYFVSEASWFFTLFFFFSSRRRHTRCLSDWSSDVCSSDLGCVHARRPLGGALAIGAGAVGEGGAPRDFAARGEGRRSEEHTSELQSLRHLVCRLLLEKKKDQHPARSSAVGQAASRCAEARR